MAKNIEFYRSDSQFINDAIDRLLMEVCFYKKEFNKKTVLLTGCGSSNGTTMIAINLAIVLSIAGCRTLLVDADLKKRNKYKRLGRDVRKGLSNYLDGESNVEEITYPTNYRDLSYIPCGASNTGSARLLCSGKMNCFIQERKDEYDFIIFDTPSVTVVPDAKVMFPSMDGIALVMSLNATTKKQLANARREAGQFGDKYCGLIINCVDKKEYERIFPQYDYFGAKRMTKQHKKWIDKGKQAKVKEIADGNRE